MDNIPNMDPLSNYDYSFTNYEPNIALPNIGDMYNIKPEPFNQPLNVPQLHTQFNGYPLPAFQEDKQIDNTVQDNVETNDTENQAVEKEEVDTKENIELLPQHRKRGPKKKGKTSSYWNKKIEDKDFAFYGCTICNVNYKTIQELDAHVTVHKGRVTSYDIRVRNQQKRKAKLKELKRLKKLGKVKCEKKKKKVKEEFPNDLTSFEIKPEDGYIGTEKASDFTEPSNLIEIQIENGSENTPDDSVKDEKPKTTDDKPLNQGKSKTSDPDDPRLLKLFKCFACHKQFALSYYLRLHVRSHTDEKPYTCAECGQSFITASKLNRHNKRIHLAVRYQCRICYRFFSRFDILTRHFDKSHEADKIEGEPYDYNAILPYLKELEEELREQNEAKEQKRKCDDSWGEAHAPNIKTDVEMKQDGDITAAGVTKMEDEKEVKPIDIDKDTAPVFLEVSDVSVKEDKYEDMIVESLKVELGEEEHLDGTLDEPLDEPDLPPDHADDSFSDEDYFPANTWAATPKVQPPEPALPNKRRPADFPIKCEHCDKTIRTNGYYKIHMRTHTGERPYKCYVCQKGFITSGKMHRHMLTHPEYWEQGENKDNIIKEEAEVKDEDCGTNGKKKKKKKKSKNAVKEEPLDKDKPEAGVKYRGYRRRPHACLYCNKRFLRIETLQIHTKSHEGEELVLKCKYCLDVMSDEAALNEHEATHTGPRPYVCTVCNRTYTKKETMVYHRKTHTADGGAGGGHQYKCEVCSKSFNAHCKLQRHLVSHKVERFIYRYECPVCAHMFHTKWHIQMHLTTHQKEGLILEENRNEILAMVMQNARKIPKKPDAAATVADLIPADERSRVCNICGQVFQHFYYLEEHLKSHGSKIAIEDEMKEEEKKHICPICNKGFKLHYYLKLHSFTHSKEKPFICQQCGKGFITKGKLKRHLETHTGLKKYQCHICYKFFTRPSYLRIHVRTIHGTQDYNFSLENVRQ